MRKVVIGDATLYHADNAEVFALQGGYDAVVTDPPYGIGADQRAEKESHGWNYYGATNWDRDRPSRVVFDALLACSKDQIIWGGNYFADLLPPSMGWLAWDKGQRGFSLADFELAWTSQSRAARQCISGRQRASHSEAARAHEVVHRTAAQPADDFRSFYGVASTGVAAIQMGRKFIGVEREAQYFEVCVRRITEAVNQGGGFFNI